MGSTARPPRRALPGDNQNARDRWVATISASMAVCGAWGLHGSPGALARTKPQNELGTPVRHTLPYSLRSSPPSDPRRSDYLRGVLCALRQLAAPLDDLGSGMRSRRDLDGLEVRDSLLL